MSQTPRRMNRLDDTMKRMSFHPRNGIGIALLAAGGLWTQPVQALPTDALCGPRSWAMPAQPRPGTDLEASDFEWTAGRIKQRRSYDFGSVENKREMHAVRAAMPNLLVAYYATAHERFEGNASDEDDARLALSSTTQGHLRGMRFRDSYARPMASGHCFHNWNLASDEQLTVDVLRRPVRLAPWSDLIRMHFVRVEGQWLFDDAEWLSKRLEPVEPASAPRP